MPGPLFTRCGLLVVRHGWWKGERGRREAAGGVRKREGHAARLDASAPGSTAALQGTWIGGVTVAECPYETRSMGGVRVFAFPGGVQQAIERSGTSVGFDGAGTNGASCGR